MSLIQEALKRKMEEKGGAGPAASPPPPPPSISSPMSHSVAPPPIPASMPGVAVGESNTVGSRNWLRLAGVVGALVVMVGLAIALIAMALKSWSARHAASAASTVTEMAKPLPPPGTVISTTPKAPPAPAAAATPEAAPVHESLYGNVIDRVADMKGKVLQNRSDDARATGGDIPDVKLKPKPAAAPAPAALPAAAQVAAKPSETVHAAATPAPASKASGSALDQGGFSLWPRVTVNGILSKGTRGRGLAIINNQMINVNDHVEGVKLLEVRGNGVLMEFGGESKFVEIGQTVQ